MQIALTLLIAAMQLLTSVQGANVPPELKTSAISIANYAIQVAQDSIKQSATTTPITPVAPTTPPPEVTQVIPQPLPITNPPIGGIITPMDLSKIEVKVGKLNKYVDGTSDISYQIYVYDVKGNSVEKPQISIVATRNGEPFDTVSPEERYQRHGYNIEEIDNKKVYSGQYSPYFKEKGNYSFTFSANGMEKTINLTIE